MEILRCENLTKTYGEGNTQIKALDNVSFVKIGFFSLSTSICPDNVILFLNCEFCLQCPSIVLKYFLNLK